MKAIHLRTEYLENPMGIDILNPQLFWNCEGGVTQTAYQIVCRDDRDHLLWDTGKVTDSAMRTVYSGKALKSRTRVLWKVCLWDEQDSQGKWSEEAFFETSLLSPSDWKAAWITGGYKADPKKRYPVDCFRKRFVSRNVVKARLYATACGVYEGCINGSRIGNFVLAPGVTDYKKRIQYQTYDITELIKDGENELTFQLADGWYRGSVGAWGLVNQYGTETKLLAQLELTMTDGSHETIVTDGSWEWSDDGPIRFADNKDGEIVDAAREPSYSGKAQKTSCDVIPSASNNIPVTEHEHFAPVRTKTPSGKLLLDFGQNMAGYIHFKFHAEQTKKIILRFGEMLDENGELTLKNIQCSNKKKTTPLQRIVYRCKKGENEYKTRFAVFGFRYCEVDADDFFDLTEADFTAIAVYSDMKQTGFFDSSNSLLNRFVESTVWSAKSNFLDIPTDCPTRERHGWTGDAQIFFDTASWLFDCAAFSRKYVQDMYDWQRKDGCLPQIVPEGGVDSYMYTMNGSVGWADAGVLIPYRFWKHYGDSSILKKYYKGMKKYARFMMKRCGKHTLLSKPLRIPKAYRKYAVNVGQSYGEWAEPEDVHPNKWTDMILPHPEVSTAYTCFVMEYMAEIASELGEKKDASLYREFADQVRRAYQEIRKLPEFTLDTDRQAMLVRPLYMNLLDKNGREYAQKRLIKALDNYGWRLGTGFLSTPLILDVLSDINVQYAYRLLENEEMPGWLFMPKHGATTVWESWEGTEAQNGIASLNHYSKGAVCAWLFETMCGIRIDGGNHFRISPKPGGSFTYAGASYDSIYGKVSCRWEKNDAGMKYTVEIPPNTTARIMLPGMESFEVKAGTYVWTVEIADKSDGKNTEEGDIHEL